MATFSTRAGKVRAQVTIGGRRESGTFHTKAEAVAWAKAKETGRLASAKDSTPVAAVLRRYADDVSVTKQGARWETLRIASWCRQDWTKTAIGNFDSAAVSAWRDARGKQVSAGTVLREMALLSSVLDTARRDWNLISVNPLKDVRRPAAPISRRRRVTQDEIDQIMHALGYAVGAVALNKSQTVAQMVLLALETGMRSGEICGLTWKHVHKTHLHLPRTKNGQARDVAMTPAAQAIIALRPKGKPDESVFDVSSTQRDALFRKARDKTLVDDIHFHDLRSEAVFRLSKKLQVLELARQIGHSDIKSLMFYYQTTGAELAEKLK
jgi:integrase